MVPIDLSGRVAIVTGGSAGMGYAIADALCRAGAELIITGRDDERLTQAARQLSDMYPATRVLGLRSDAASVAETRDMVSHVAGLFGKIDILVNNAGTNIPQLALEVQEDDWDRVMNVNLKGLFFCCQAVGKCMVRQKRGKIINVASQMGLVGLQKRAAYCSSKGGVVQLTKVLAIEWAPYNVQVNAVGPTFTDTPLARSIFSDRDFYEDVIRRIPMGRIAKPEDTAGAVLYLASDLANFVTGHTLLVDGGWVAW